MNALIKTEVTKSDKKKEEESEDEEFDDEAFSELFPKLMEMRSKTLGLDFEKRRRMAEKVCQRHWICDQYFSPLKSQYGAATVRFIPQSFRLIRHFCTFHLPPYVSIIIALFVTFLKFGDTLPVGCHHPIDR